MKHSLLFLAGMILLVAIFTGAYFIGGPGTFGTAESGGESQVQIVEQDKPAGEEPLEGPLALWRKGARQMYNLEISTSMLLNAKALTASEGRPDQSFQGSTVSIKGTLNCHVYEELDDVTYVGYQLHLVKVDLNGKPNTTMENLFGTFFVVAFLPDGRPFHFYFPPSLSAEDTNSLSELVYGLQIVIPSQDGIGIQSEWDMEEQNQTGPYESHYQLSQDRTLITKEKKRYLSLNTSQKNAALTGVFTPEITASRLRATLDPKVAWVRDIEAEETLLILTEKKDIFSEVQVATKLSLAPYVPNAELTVWKQGSRPLMEIIAAIAKTDLDEKAPQGYWAAVRKGELETVYRSREVSSSVKELTEVVKTMNDHTDTIAALHSLRDNLEAYPERSLEIPRLVKEPGMSDDVSARVIHALELAQHPEAQHALATIMQDPKQPHSRRIQAIIAAGGIKAPQKELIASLMELNNNTR